MRTEGHKRNTSSPDISTRFTREKWDEQMKQQGKPNEEALSEEEEKQEEAEKRSGGEVLSLLAARG